MFLLEGASATTTTVVTSATDLVLAAKCEFAFLRRLDAKLGRDVLIPDVQDEMLARAATLGDEHEARQLSQYIAEYGSGRVVQIGKPKAHTSAGLIERQNETLEALRSDARVVFQATFFEPEQRVLSTGDAIGFVGFADFLLRSTDAWQVEDTKLARRPKPEALMQIAAYAEQLQRLGLAVHEKAVIILGDGARSEHSLHEIAPVFRSRRQRMYELTELALGRKEVTAWGASGVQVCGRCEICEAEVQRTRDTLLIAAIRTWQRDKLLAAGLKTIDDVARLHSAQLYSAQLDAELGADKLPEVAGIQPKVLARLAAQAYVQLASESETAPVWTLVNPEGLAVIPPSSPGDLFFDFEGDPLFNAKNDSGSDVWGLDYLFGMVDERCDFTAFWAHDLAGEKQALLDFLDFVKRRRAEFPDMHIYHYAPYEKTHLKLLAARHGVGEDEVDDLLRDEVLVDLYYAVKNSLLVGSRSYSIKKLEPLYMGDEHRDEGGVTTGADSVVEYARAVELLYSGNSAKQREGQERLAAIAEYNKYDCVSTLKLRDWLQRLATERGVTPAAKKEEREAKPEEEERSALANELMRRAQSYAEQGMQSERNIYALASSAIDYHRRERKSFWWEHFARLEAPIEEWADTKDVFVVAEGVGFAAVTLVSDWGRPPRARKDQRQIFLPGSFAPGSSVRVGDSVFAIYEGGIARRATLVEYSDLQQDNGVIIKELVGEDGERWREWPIALTPGPPPAPGTQVPAIEEWGKKLLKADPNNGNLRDPVADIIARRPPTLRNGAQLKQVSADETITAVTETVLQLERSALAVQGPPGTGKTYLAARVIKSLVEQHGWRVGVVAQSHRVVENVLDGIVDAGLDPTLVAKALQRGSVAKPGGSGAQQKFTAIDSKSYSTFLVDNTSGCVIGGTAWTFSNPNQVARDSLDLLVIDEAGQFSLAPTIAASVAAKRLLLLGDPQQLPQVSQGTHPEPVDESALGWLIGEHETLPAELGYFLAETRRMRPELTRVVSALSYENKLRSHESTHELDYTWLCPPGLTWHPTPHTGNTTSSVEEAAETVRIVRDLTQQALTHHPLTQHDIIVVAPYNAQVDTIATALADAGFAEIRVGTVDKFQGQEALIAIVSLAASSPADVPRGLDFLLMPNRLNVAISRAKWAAHLISSPFLGGSGLPTSLPELRALGAYLGLTESSAFEPAAIEAPLSKRR